MGVLLDHSKDGRKVCPRCAFDQYVRELMHEVFRKMIHEMMHDMLHEMIHDVPKFLWV